MTKVEHTKTHCVVKNLIGGNEIPTLVADAKLVLVECDEQTDLKTSIGGQPVYFKPILISETERIEVGDWRYHIHEHTINEPHHRLEHGENTFDSWKKILALPEHFSPEQLQDIVDGKLKDGDKVLVECEDVIIDNGNHDNYTEYLIKLNPHITIYPVIKDLKFYENNAQDDFVNTPISVLRYISELEESLKKKPVEEKMYTKEEVIELIEKFRQSIDNYKVWSKSAKEWFEQNVK